MRGYGQRDATGSGRSRTVAPVVRLLVSGALAGALAAAPPPADAQDQPLDFAGAVIEGQVLAPEVTIFVARDNLLKNYNIVFEESFLHKIVESIEEPPF